MANRRFQNSFAQSFMLGWKGMEDSEYKKALTNYYKSKAGGAKSIYGYTPTAKEEPSLLGRIFGGGGDKEEPLSDVDQGKKNLLDVYNQAIRAGDIPTANRIRADIAKEYGGTGKPAAAAKPGQSNVDLIKKTNDVPVIELTPEEKAAKAKEDENNKKVKLNESNPLEGVDTGEKLPVTKDLASLDPRQTPYQVAELDPNTLDADDPDKLDGALDLSESAFAKNGGMITAAHAALGGMMRNPVQRTALGGAPTGAIGEPMEQEPPPSDEEEQQDPALVYPEEDEDKFARQEITRQLAERAAPAVNAVVEKVSTAPKGAIPDGSEASPQPVKSMSHEEVKAIDQMIDPENKLPAEAKAAARVSAMWDFYSERDPEKAADAVNSLLAYDKKNSMTRAQLAIDAFKGGKNQDALKLLTDAHNNDVPGGAMIQNAVLRSDGGVNITMRNPDGSIEEIPATIPQVQQIAQNSVTGTTYNQQLQDIARQYQAKQPQKQEIDKDLLRSWDQARSAYITALDNVTKDPSEENKKAFQAAKDLANTTEKKAKEWAFDQKNPLQALKDLGIGNIPLTTGSPSPKGPPGKPVYPKPPTLNKDEKALKAFDDELDKHFNDLNESQKLIDGGFSVTKDGTKIPRANPHVPITDEERAASAASIAPFQQRQVARIMDTYYRFTDPKLDKDDQNFEAREKKLDTALNEYFKRSNKDDKDAERPVVPRTGKDQFFKPNLSKDELAQALREDRNQMQRTGSLLAKKNDVSSTDIVRFMDGFITNQNPPKFDLKNGRVEVGNIRLYIDSDSLQDLTSMRRDYGDAIKNAGDQKRYEGALDLGLSKGKEQVERSRIKSEIQYKKDNPDRIDFTNSARSLEEQYKKFGVKPPDDGGSMPKYPGVSLP
jgi:hypothetical protein